MTSDINWSSYVALMNIHDPIAVEVMNDCRAIFWHDSEFDYDIEGFSRLSPNVRKPLEYCLTFFSGFDGIVEGAIGELMSNLVDHKEQKDLYVFHSMMESIHGSTYTRLIKAIAIDHDHAFRMQNSATKYASIMAQAQYLLDVAKISNKISRPEKLLTLACCECLFFCPLFTVIFYYNFKYQGAGYKFDDLDETNTLIARDETIHYRTHIHFMKFYGGLEADKIRDIITRATDLALASVDEMLKPIDDSEQIQLSSSDLKNYVRFQANRLSKMAGGPMIYNINVNPLPWMVNIETHTKTNPFERDNMNYQSNIGTTIGDFSFSDISKI